ncbi:hypothetical protein [Actinacidiphila acidipaludis]|uniref:WXG100 family type VII secretion target n=1 Tax=Actinacidiphila acidipaludis TaxID=2873382 RepID=A0ABS7Q809_9ACTN|nr:hypothetical protein [Streptomyces acidipaludis]MBY8879307.1 hypothetical protein [Streptomyces acidipaludis]
MTEDRLAIPIGLLEDFASQLGSIVRRLDDTKATFKAFEEDMGDASVVGALDHFEHNWKDGRGDIHKQLSGLEKMANTVVREMRKVDVDLAKQLAQSSDGTAPAGQGNQ